MRIAIVGATGMLGQPVTRELIRAGFAIRLIVRDVAKARALFPDADIVSADLRKVDSLRDALAGMDTVYLNLSIRQNEKQTDFHTESDGLQNLLQAAQASGVQRIAYLSSIIMRYQGRNGLSWWVFDIKQRAVGLIKASGISYSIFYPSCFMDSLNGTQRIGRFILLVGRSDVKPMYIAASEYGKQVARAFITATAGQNQEYVIQGPEAITQQEAAERFVRAYKKNRLYIVTTPAWMMKLGGLLSAQADYGWHITEALNNYPEVVESQKTWEDLGKPTTTVESFARSL